MLSWRTKSRPRPAAHHSPRSTLVQGLAVEMSQATRRKVRKFQGSSKGKSQWLERGEAALPACIRRSPCTRLDHYHCTSRHAETLVVQTQQPTNTRHARLKRSRRRDGHHSDTCQPPSRRADHTPGHALCDATFAATCAAISSWPSTTSPVQQSIFLHHRQIQPIVAHAVRSRNSDRCASLVQQHAFHVTRTDSSRYGMRGTG